MSFQLSHNLARGDWGGFPEDCTHLRYPEQQPLERVNWLDRDRDRNIGSGAHIVARVVRGFATDRITYEAMNAYARNSPYSPKVRKLFTSESVA